MYDLRHGACKAYGTCETRGHGGFVGLAKPATPVGPVGPLPQSVVIAGHCKGSLVVSIREGVVGYGWVGKTKVGVG